MAGERHGVASYPGVISVVGCQYTHSYGISPGVVLLQCHPQASPFAIEGDVIITDGVGTVTIPRCRLHRVREDIDGSGQTVTLELLDRRWRWRELGHISGSYNQLDAHGKLIPWKIRSPAELVQECLNAMGEVADVIDLPPGLDSSVGLQYADFFTSGLNFPPTGTNPPISWEVENPANCLQRLCDLFGRRIVWNLVTNRLSIVPIGVGANIPLTESLAKLSPGMSARQLPDGIKVIGAKNRYQFRALLEPYGEDWDGRLVPIDNLTYAPKTKDARPQITTITLWLPNPIPADLTMRLTVMVNNDPSVIDIDYDGSFGDDAEHVITDIHGQIPSSANVTAAIANASAERADLVLTGPVGQAFDVDVWVDGTGGDMTGVFFYAEQTQASQVEERSWLYSPPPTFPGVRATERLTRQEARALAQKSVWKFYRVRNKDPQTAIGNLTIPGFGEIGNIHQLYLLDTKVQQVVPTSEETDVVNPQGNEFVQNYYNGYSRDEPASVHGSVCNIGQGVAFMNLDATGNTPEASRVYIPFSIDPVHQMVIFSEHVYKVANNGRSQITEVEMKMPFTGLIPADWEVTINGHTVSSTSGGELWQVLEDLASAINTDNPPGSNPLASLVIAEANYPDGAPDIYAAFGTTLEGRYSLTITGLTNTPFTCTVMPDAAPYRVLEQRTVRPASTDRFAPGIEKPVLTLETSCYVADAITNAYMRFELFRDFVPNARQYAVQKREDVQLGITAEYDDDNALVSHQLLEIDPVARANFYLDTMQIQYQLKDAQIATINGIVYIPLDGTISQISWSVGDGGAMTTVSRNTEHDIWTPLYPARRRNEALPSVVNRPLEDQNDNPATLGRS